jgi:DNA-binding transcriptional MerR regulator
MPEKLSAGELARQVNAWCDEHQIAPANGQAGDAVTERNVRFYRTTGLLDAPDGGFGEKHLLQLIAVRILQAQGLPLRRIRELLHGRNLEDLRELRRRGAAEVRAASPTALFGGTDALWRVTPLDEDFLLVSRRGTPLTPAQRAALTAALRGPAFRKPQN